MIREAMRRPGSRRAALLSIWMPFVFGTGGFIALVLLTDRAPIGSVVAAIVTCTALNLGALLRALAFGGFYGTKDRQVADGDARRR